MVINQNYLWNAENVITAKQSYWHRRIGVLTSWFAFYKEILFDSERMLASSFDEWVMQVEKPDQKQELPMSHLSILSFSMFFRDSHNLALWYLNERWIRNVKCNILLLNVQEAPLYAKFPFNSWKTTTRWTSVQNVPCWPSSKEEQQSGQMVSIHTIQSGGLQRATFSSCSLVMWKLHVIVLTLAFPSSPSWPPINLWYLLKCTACLRTQSF